jgi:hypothetical protein
MSLEEDLAQAILTLPATEHTNKEEHWSVMLQTLPNLTTDPVFRAVFDNAFELAMGMREEHGAISATQDECFL